MVVITIAYHSLPPPACFQFICCRLINTRTWGARYWQFLFTSLQVRLVILV